MKWTLSKAAPEWGTTRETLKRGLRLAGIPERKTYTTRDIDRALHDDLKLERARETGLRADLLELKRQQKSGDLVTMDEARCVIAEALAPVRSKLMAMPSTLALRCNPSDPDLARTELEKIVREILL